MLWIYDIRILNIYYIVVIIVFKCNLVYVRENVMLMMLGNKVSDVFWIK